jgi:hypothetical protein
LLLEIAPAFLHNRIGSIFVGSRLNNPMIPKLATANNRTGMSRAWHSAQGGS